MAGSRSRALLATGSVLVPAVLLVLLALWTAAGVTRIGPADYDTEFIHPVWWNACWLLVIPVFVAARACPKLAWLLVLCAALPQFGAAAATVRRYELSGFADGLEHLTYLLAIVLTLAFALAGLLGRRAGRRRPAG